MIATTLERAGAITIGYNPREFKDKQENQDNRYRTIQQTKPDAVVSVIRGVNHFKKDYFEGFDGPIIDVTTEKDKETGRTA